MRNFKPINDTAESVEKRMTFIQEFLQKKYGFGILFFVVIGFGIFVAIKTYNEGKNEGAVSSRDQINSLKESSKNDSIEIRTLNGRVAYYKKIYDTCINRTTNIDLEDEVRKQLERTRRLERLMEQKINNTEKQTNDINTIIK